MLDYVLRDTRYYEISLISVARFGEKERRALLNSRVLLGATYHVTHIYKTAVVLEFIIGQSILAARTVGENSELQSAMSHQYFG